MKRFVLLLACAGLVVAGPVRADEDLTPDQVSAYVALVKADQARDRGASEDALRGYREALDKYKAIAQKDPRWHPELVQYRLAYCANELEALRRRVEGKPAEPASPAPAASASPAPRDDSAQIAALRQRIADLEAEAAAAPKAARKLESANAKLQGENDRLSADVQRLRAAVEDLQPLTEATQAVARLMAEQTGLAEERDRLSSETRRLQRRVSDLEKALAEKDDARRAGDEARAAQAVADRTELLTQLVALSNRLAEATAARDTQAGSSAEDLAAARAESERLQAALKKAQDDADSWSKRHAAVMTQKEALEQRTQELYQKTLELDRGAQACEKTRAELDRANQALAVQLTRATNDLATAGAEQSAKARALQDEVAKLEEQSQALRETIDLQEREMNRVRELKKEIADLKDNKDALEKSLKAQGRELDQLRDEGAIEQLSAQVNALRAELDATRERLDAAEKQARDLLKENTFLKRRS